jgi:small subunit ribosomal protein S16
MSNQIIMKEKGEEMLKIRLKRLGRKNQPQYRIVVTEHTQPVSGEYLEKIGNYEPALKAITLDKEKAIEWMNKGAKPTNTVAKLFEKEGVKHKLIVIKKFAAKSKKQLELEKKQDEEEKAKERAEKEAAKEEFDKKVAEEKAEAEAVAKSEEAGEAAGSEKTEEKTEA